MGGGLAELWRPLAVKKEDQDLSVVVVDKYFAARGGKATRAAASLTCCRRGGHREFLSFDIEQIGEYLNEQVAQRKYIAPSTTTWS